MIALYVLKDHYGKGAGQELMKVALTELSAFQDIYLWVLDDNYRAKAFYQKIGFAFDGEEKIINDEVFQKIDCTACANCCKTLGPDFKEADIVRIAKYFKMKLPAF